MTEGGGQKAEDRRQMTEDSKNQNSNSVYMEGVI